MWVAKLQYDAESLKFQPLDKFQVIAAILSFRLRRIYHFFPSQVIILKTFFEIFGTWGPRSQRPPASLAGSLPLALLAVAVDHILKDSGIANGKGDFFGDGVQQQALLVRKGPAIGFIDNFHHPDLFFPRRATTAIS